MEKINATFASEESRILRDLLITELKDRKKILSVDDSEDIRELLSVLLNNEGAVSMAINGMDALSMFRSKSFDLVVSDIEMPIMNGIELYETVTRLYPKYKNRFLFFSGAINAEHIDSLSRNNLMLLRKPHDIHKLRLAVHQKLFDISTHQY
jgi:DNA-binding NtrC family response regulator